MKKITEEQIRTLYEDIYDRNVQFTFSGFARKVESLLKRERENEQQLISKIFVHSNMTTEQIFGKGVVERFKDVLYKAFRDKELRAFWQKSLDENAE